MSSNWCTIESDPAVFSSLIESFGVKNAQLTELYSLDEGTLLSLNESYGKIHGLVFLFKWQGNEATDETDRVSDEDAPEDLFFSRQMITNACATQALLSILLNAKATDDGSDEDNTGAVSLGEILSTLKSFTASFPPDLKGEAIGASDEIREAHNSFARKEAFLVDENKKRIATKDDEVFHFIAYVPHSNGIVYELDGLQNGPINVGSFDNTMELDNGMGDLPWLTVACAAIQKRIEKYQSSEIKFNLMALTQDRRNYIQSKIKAMLEAGLSESDEAISALNMDLMHEEEQRKQWEIENERRRHNYLPFCMELIRALAKSGNLQECTRKAREKTNASGYRGI
ncbi:hypothetical protein CTEN210_08414 [Chaetoceros tenuissimus]|uniref:Ubiquitin carboxyl-terminal hydrolase n=1 Tax=Chaetoceros tenuissimus TaxID=426638 RepID=A0AAD3CTN2_9STRA|nr:hypothetical protein CTEN210_08414 [Chaetoceros tenuissimus]